MVGNTVKYLCGGGVKYCSKNMVQVLYQYWRSNVQYLHMCCTQLKYLKKNGVLVEPVPVTFKVSKVR